jgi:DNA-binding IclR family transcriptional regulator
VSLPRTDPKPISAAVGADRQADCRGGLQSVLAALDLLDCFAQREEFGVSELARNIGVAKSTAHRLLTTLCARGFAERDEESGRYRLGLHLYELGHLAVSRSDIRNAALPILQDMHHRTGATTHIGVPDGDEIIYLERIIGRESLNVWAKIGRRLPTVTTSSGKAIYAYSPRFANGRLQGPLPDVFATDSSMAGRYRVALQETAKRGFALSVDESLKGLTSIAAPVLGHDGVARAAVSMVGPTAKMLADIQNPARLVQFAAKKLSRELCL